MALTGSMAWEILWALVLGFALSAVVQAVVRRDTIVRLDEPTQHPARSCRCSCPLVAPA